MKTPLLATSLAVALALFGCDADADVDAIAAAASAKVGQPAPAFKLTDSTGKARSLAEFKGKTVVLEWTNAECPFVKKHYGAKNMQAQQKAATADGVVWLSVNSGAPGEQGHVDGPGAQAFAGKPCFLLTDHIPMPKNTFHTLDRLGAKRITLGPTMLFASQCVVLIHHALDER